MRTSLLIKRVIFAVVSGLCCFYISPIALAAESAKELLQKMRATENLPDAEAADLTLKALALEPSIPEYFLKVSAFDYIPSEDTNLLSAMALSYWPAYFKRSKDYISVLSLLERYARLQPDNPDIRANLAYLYLMKGEDGLKNAFQAFSEALQIDPAHRNSLRYVSGLSQKFPPYDVEKLLTGLCKREPDNPYACQALGYFYYGQEKLDEAIQAYEKACEQDSRAIEIRHALGHLYLEKVKGEISGSGDEVLFKDRANVLFYDALILAEEREGAILRQYYELIAADTENPLPFEQWQSGLRESIIDANSDNAAIEAIVSVWILRLERANFFLNYADDLDKVEKEVLAAESLFLERPNYQDDALAGGTPVNHMLLDAGNIGVPGPSAIRRQLAKRYDALGDKVGAMRAGRIKICESIRKDKIDNLRRQALDLFNKRELEAAQACYRQAIALGSEAPEDFLRLSDAAYELGDYSNSAWARGRYIAMTGADKVSSSDWFQFAYAHALRGDYKSAANAARELCGHFPADNGLFEWLVVFEYGAYGWAEAVKLWEERYPGSFEIAGRKRLEKEDEFLSKIYGGARKLAEAAEAKNNLYSALSHYSAALSVIKDQFPEIKKEITDKIAEIYGRLPEKLKPPPIAVKYALEAQEDIGRNEISRARTALYNAIGTAPWWPEARYNLALLYGAGVPEAVRQMELFLRLAPFDPRADIARKKITGWQKILQEAIARGAEIREGFPFLIKPDKEGW